MAAEIKKLLKRFETEGDQADGVFSIFDKWLEEDECEVALMTSGDVVSFEKYDQVKKIERQYLELIVDLSRTFELRLLRSNSSKAETNIAKFNDLYSAISRHINHDRTFEVYLSEIEALVAFSHDFTPLFYLSQTSEIEKLRNVFLRNRFHELR